MPVEEGTKMSKGFAFIEFSKPQVRRCSGLDRMQRTPWGAAAACAGGVLRCSRRLARPHAQEAHAARDQTNGYKLDKNHVFAVNMFDDFNKYAKVPEEYVAPEPKAFSATVSCGCYLLTLRLGLGATRTHQHAHARTYRAAHNH